MNFIRQTALSALLLASLGSAQALTTVQQISFDSNLAPLKSTNWSVEAWLPQFDSRLGTLDSVTISLASHLEGSAKAESTNEEARNITLKLQASFKLVDLTSGATWLQHTEAVNHTFAATAYDGTDDFGGGSGRSFLGLIQDGSIAQTFTDSTMLARFTGNGSVGTLLSAKGESRGEGSSSIDTQFRTKASGYASVSYSYHTTAVPEPGTWALMAAGLGLVMMLASRRRAD
jgi:PEP-CTERM motif